MIISSLRALRAVKLFQVSDLQITTVMLTWFGLFRTFFLQLWVGYNIEINWGDLRHLVVAFAPHTVVTRCNQVCLRQNHGIQHCDVIHANQKCVALLLFLLFITNSSLSLAFLGSMIPLGTSESTCMVQARGSC